MQVHRTAKRNQTVYLERLGLKLFPIGKYENSSKPLLHSFLEEKGYSHSLTDAKRQKLLSDTIDEKIPNGWWYEYSELWGMPGSQQRIDVIAIDLNNFIRNNELLNHNGQFDYAFKIFRKDRNFIINIQNHGF